MSGGFKAGLQPCSLIVDSIGEVRRMSGQGRIVKLRFRRKDVSELEAISRSRTEAASRVDRARVLLAYRADRSFYAVSQTLSMSYQTVRRCLERAEELRHLPELDLGHARPLPPHRAERDPAQ